MDKTEYAVECYNSGFSCSQAVFTAFCEDYGIDRKLGLKIAGSFGGGMGHTGGACGAVTGALMVLGLKYGKNSEEGTYSKALNYLVVKDFVSRFKKINGSVYCKDLINYDISDENQLNQARGTDIFTNQCPEFIKCAISLLNDVMSEYTSER